jgi:fermentation-respiration switch protein FrsA (DUF1100 family)
MDFILAIIAFLSIAYLLVVGVMFIVQRHMIYHPVRHLGVPESYGFIRAKQIELPTDDGHTIKAWYTPPTTRQETIVYFHGNRGNIGNRAHKLIAFAKEGYGVLAVSWRGFGGSTGKPSERGLLKDAHTAIKWLHIPHEQMILYGESLGSGVAVQMATEYPVSLIMLEAPYASIRGRAQELYPWLPVHYILRDHFDSISHISKIKSPLLIIHGENDEVMPVSHSKRLFEAAPDPKRMVLYPHVHHTDFSMQQILQPLAEVLGNRKL